MLDSMSPSPGGTAQSPGQPRDQGCRWQWGLKERLVQGRPPIRKPPQGTWWWWSCTEVSIASCSREPSAWSREGVPMPWEGLQVVDTKEPAAIAPRSLHLLLSELVYSECSPGGRLCVRATSLWPPRPLGHYATARQLRTTSAHYPVERRKILIYSILFACSRVMFWLAITWKMLPHLWLEQRKREGLTTFNRTPTWFTCCEITWIQSFISHYVTEFHHTLKLMLQIFKHPMPHAHRNLQALLGPCPWATVSYAAKTLTGVKGIRWSSCFKHASSPCPRQQYHKKKIGPNDIFEFHTSEFKLHLGPCQWATVQIARTFVLMLQVNKLYLAPCP